MTTRGFSVLAVIGLLTVASVLGLAMASLVTTSQAVRTDQLESDHAHFLNLAGIEFGLARFCEGKSPVVNNQSLGRGGFRTTVEGNDLVATSWSGESRVNHRVRLPTEADCIQIDTTESHTHHEGMELARIYLRKRCALLVRLDRMTLSWEPNNGESYERVRLSSAEPTRIYDAPPRVRSGERVDLIDSQMARNQAYKMKEIRFRDSSGRRVDMRSKEGFSLRLIYGDSSEKEVNFTLAPCPHSSC
jgi:hypothetical protein